MQGGQSGGDVEVAVVKSSEAWSAVVVNVMLDWNGQEMVLCLTKEQKTRGPGSVGEQVYMWGHVYSISLFKGNIRGRRRKRSGAIEQREVHRCLLVLDLVTTSKNLVLGFACRV